MFFAEVATMIVPNAVTGELMTVVLEISDTVLASKIRHGQISDISFFSIPRTGVVVRSITTSGCERKLNEKEG